MLRFEQLALRRGPRLLFEQADFSVYPGQKLGITGANGSGKSSLFALILGQLHADGGDFFLPRDWVIAHVGQETPADPRAALEYVLDGDAELRLVERRIARAEADGEGERLGALHGQLEAIDGYTAPSRAAQLLAGLGFAPGEELRPVSEFSGGWRMRLNLARALMCRSDLLLLDEPTNHLDLDAVIWLEEWLRAYQGTLLLIAHDRDFLDGVCTHIAQLEDFRLELYNGNYSAFERLRSERLATRAAEYAKQQREMAHMRAFVDRFRAKASKARQAQSRIKALERMELIAPAHVDSPFHFAFKPPEKSPHPLLTVEAASAGYGQHEVLSGIELPLAPGDRIGLLGRNGAGKSTLIKLLAGNLQPLGGVVERARDLRVGYFAQHQLEQLDPDASPLTHLQRIDPKARDQQLRSFLGGFGFSNEQALTPTRPFSGGEKSRLALALIVYLRPNLLLLDEPTNHLDLEMRQSLAVALQDYDGAMVLVSHDRHLLRVCCDELLLVADKQVATFPGSLDDYPRWLAESARAERPRSTPGAGDHSAASRKARKRRSADQRQRIQPLRRKARAAERELALIHEQQLEMEDRLAAPDLYQPVNKSALKELLLEQSSLERRCKEQEALWLKLAQELEALESS
ncbi:MAG: ATP-binding cassette domain-containing protein [Gammaproteobacteria bacterium]